MKITKISNESTLYEFNEYFKKIIKKLSIFCVGNYGVKLGRTSNMLVTIPESSMAIPNSSIPNENSELGAPLIIPFYHNFNKTFH